MVAGCDCVQTVGALGPEYIDAIEGSEYQIVQDLPDGTTVVKVGDGGETKLILSAAWKDLVAHEDVVAGIDLSTFERARVSGRRASFEKIPLDAQNRGFIDIAGEEEV